MASITRYPLKRGVPRVVTIANDTGSQSICRLDDILEITVKKNNGYKATIVEQLNRKIVTKMEHFPDGSYNKTTNCSSTK